MARRVVLGTRGSALALWQARHVAARLAERHPGLRIEERILKTEGDIQQSRPIGPDSVGVFVRRLEQALLAGEIDLAVHSLKDMPTDQPPALSVSAVPERHDPRDVLLSPEGHALAELPAGSVIGTGSFRRRAQLLHARPDLQTRPVRGNVDTRIRKLLDGRFGALALALAGVERLGIDHVPFRPLEPEVCLPAVGQGALGIEIRQDDRDTRQLVAGLDHEPSHQAVRAERSFLRTLGGGCLAPATAYARFEGGRLRVRAAVGDADGVQLLRDEIVGTGAKAEELGTTLARRMIEAGAGRLLERARESARAEPGR